MLIFNLNSLMSNPCNRNANISHSTIPRITQKYIIMDHRNSSKKNVLSNASGDKQRSCFINSLNQKPIKSSIKVYK